MSLPIPLNLQFSDGNATSNARGGNSSNVITNSTSDNTIFWISLIVMGYIIVTTIKRKK